MSIIAEKEQITYKLGHLRIRSSKHYVLEIYIPAVQPDDKDMVTVRVQDQVEGVGGQIEFDELVIALAKLMNKALKRSSRASSRAK